jgi:hypothetical protein
MMVSGYPPWDDGTYETLQDQLAKHYGGPVYFLIFEKLGEPALTETNREIVGTRHDMASLMGQESLQAYHSEG